MLTGISLFSGAGGLDLAAKWAGIRTVAYVEYDPYAQGVLLSRMRDGSLDDAPIFEDVRTFDGRSLRGRVDVVWGGFPCQDVSVAGKQAGIKAGARSGLWREFARIIRDVGPRFVLVENVPGLLIGGGLGYVLGDLAAMGFDAQWEVLSAASVGAPHLRDRVWIVAHSNSGGLSGSEIRQEQPRRTEIVSPGKIREGCEMANAASHKRSWAGNTWSRWNGPTNGRKDVADPNGIPGPQTSKTLGSERKEWDARNDAGRSSRESEPRTDWWATEPNVGRVANGVAFRVDRLRCCGNGVVPQQAQGFFEKIAAP